MTETPAEALKANYEARICPGIPTDCCDYGVISHETGKEVCRVWTEEDARRIADLLNLPRPPAADAGEVLGEALFVLSDRLRADGFLDRKDHHAIYERVVAAFNAVPSGEMLRTHLASPLDPDGTFGLALRMSIAIKENCEIGAGEASIDQETGLLCVVADLDMQGIARRVLFDAPATLGPQAPSPTFADGIETACAAFEQAISDGYPEPVGKSAKCPHGLYSFEECITCYDEALTARIAEIRGDAGVVRTYREGLDAAAKVAEHDVPQSDEAGVAVGEAKAGVRIAAAIRGLV